MHGMVVVVVVMVMMTTTTTTMINGDRNTKKKDNARAAALAVVDEVDETLPDKAALHLANVELAKDLGGVKLPLELHHFGLLLGIAMIDGGVSDGYVARTLQRTRTHLGARTRTCNHTRIRTLCGLCASLPPHSGSFFLRHPSYLVLPLLNSFLDMRSTPPNAVQRGLTVFQLGREALSELRQRRVFGRQAADFRLQQRFVALHDFADNQGQLGYVLNRPNEERLQVQILTPRQHGRPLKIFLEIGSCCL